jgi:hypothetical protein
MQCLRLCAGWLSILAISPGARADVPPTPRSPGRISIVELEREPALRHRPKPAELGLLRDAVTQSPKSRSARFQLVRALMAADALEEAERAARDFREHDAYNLLAVRLLGDIQTARGDTLRARRTYSAIVELLPKEVGARHALATVMKQAGDLEGARAELQMALELRSDDRRTTLELGDIEQRLGQTDAAAKLFELTANAPEASEALRYPARQRLAQIYAAERRKALGAHNLVRAAELALAIEKLGMPGALENDIKVFLSWDTDRSDVDLWVTTPSGEKIFYGHRRGASGEMLFDDVTTGYGPESFTAKAAVRGEYLIQVNFFGSRASEFKQARGEVTVILDEGRETERRSVLPYRLYDEKDTVSVARVHVSRGEQS